MERERRAEVINLIKDVMKRTGLQPSEILERYNAAQDTLAEGERVALPIEDIKEALKDEARDPMGIILSSKKGRSTLYRIKSAPKENTSKEKPGTDTSDTNKIGTGGEHLVLAELLFRGYEANIMSVDDGIDIVASKDGKIYFVQVKTTYLDNDHVSVSIPVQSFDRVKAHDVRYFIVIRRDLGNAKFLMFHQSEIVSHSKNGYIDKSDTNYNIKIRFRTDGIPVLYNSRGDETRVPSAMQDEHKFDL